MPVVISPNGQPVFAISQDVVNDFLRQGYRLPSLAPDPTLLTPTPVPAPASPGSVPVAGTALDLMTANLLQLRAIEGIGTSRAKEIRALAQAGTLTLDTLQSDVPEVDWVAMYRAGLVTWPGGLTRVEAE